MPNFGYSIIALDPDKTAKSSGRDLRISPKAAREICSTIRYMRLDMAKSILQGVIEKKRPIPYKRYKREVPHRHGLEKWSAGRYPVKAARQILRLLENAEANATYKGLDVEKLKIIHAASQRARKIKRRIPRAFGRSSPNFEQLAHVEIVVEEEES